MNITDEHERKLHENLDYLLIRASLDVVPSRDFARALCKKVANFAKGDKELSDIIRKNLKQERHGRRNEWTKKRLVRLLFEYVKFIEYSRSEAKPHGDHAEALKWLVDRGRRRAEALGGHARYTTGAIDTRISEAIQKIAIDELPEIARDWAKPIIDYRRTMGDKRHKRDAPTHWP